MTTISGAGTMSGGGSGILDREHTIAKAGFNRWLVPPAALCIHLCIGMAYGFSVFWLPLSRAIGLTAPKACPDISLVQELFTTTCDWKVASMGWMFTLFFVALGVSAAIWGGWLERAGPRKAGFVAAMCWGGGLIIGAFGIYVHQLWIMWLGAGVIGGIGLGLGYISPVSTLIKWFPDHRGMATGMAIMGFGGGAMIGAPLANILINYFKTPTDVGVWQTFVVMGVIYFVFMTIGAFAYRVTPAGWQPEGWTPPSEKKSMISEHHVHLDDAHKTPQFWLIWWVLVSERVGRHRRDRHGLADVAGDLRRQADRNARPDLQRAFGSSRRRRSRGSRPALPACCRCSTSAAVSSGRRCRTISAARTPITASSCSASRSTRWRRPSPRWARRRCSCSPSASSCRCMAAASPPCRPISPTCSEPSSSAPFTAGC